VRTLALFANFTIAITCAASCSLLTNLDGLLGNAGALDATPEARTTWCSNVDATFCCDFDQSNSADAAGWTSLLTQGGGTLNVQQFNYTSAPNAGAVTIPAVQDAGTNALAAVAAFEKLISVDGGTHLVVEWDMNAQSMNGSAAFALAFANGLDSVILTYGSSLGWVLAYAGGTQYVTLDAAVPFSAWVRLRLDVDFRDAPNGSVALSIVHGDGTLSSLAKVSGVRVRDEVDGAAGPVVTLTAGLGVGSGLFTGAKAQAFIDNVVIQTP
jgi:hypothetical protein